MKLTEEDMEIIDAYLLGKLKGAALSDFEQRLKEEESFAKEVEEMRAVMLAVKRSSLEDKMKLLQQEELKIDDVETDFGYTNTETSGLKTNSSNSEHAKTKRLPWRTILGVAASVLVIGVVGFWWSMDKSSSNSKALLNFPESPSRYFGSEANSNLYNAAGQEGFQLYEFGRELLEGNDAEYKKAFLEASKKLEEAYNTTADSTYLIYLLYSAKASGDDTRYHELSDKYNFDLEE